ncbi:MAG: YlxR family protein [Desulfohalobiaceae bacterium]
MPGNKKTPPKNRRDVLNSFMTRDHSLESGPRSLRQPSQHPVRMCVVCRGRFVKQDLQRYVCPVGSEALLLEDGTGTLPGRGFYVCASEECRSRFPKFRGWQKMCNRGRG